MNYTKNHRLAGHFALVSKDEKTLVVHILGFKRENLKQTDINYICSFYHFPRTEKWLIEDKRNYDYKVTIQKEAPINENYQ